MAYTAENAFHLIESAHKRGRLAHAFLIIGEAGSGKSDLAARVISLINPSEDSGAVNLFGDTEQPQQKQLGELEGELVRIIRPQSKSRRIRVDDIRTLEKSFYTASVAGQWKVGVIMHADRMNEQAENAFLKTLEEPPDDSLLLLLTDAPELLLPTILSRCVRLPLMVKAEARVTNAAQDELLAGLAKTARQGLGSIEAALELRAVFSDILARRRVEISKPNDLALKEEVKKYKKATEGDWLELREKFYIAQTESEYLSEREKLLEIFISWFGDVLRQKCAVERLDFPAEKKITASVAEAHELSDLLQRMDAVGNLCADMETNVQEQLAMEVAFLTAFG